MKIIVCPRGLRIYVLNMVRVDVINILFNSYDFFSRILEELPRTLLWGERLSSLC